MRIATWNIGGGFISSKNDLNFDLENLDYFISELKNINPDIVCFQEAHISDNQSQPDLIAKRLGLPYVVKREFSKSHLKNGEMLSVATISRYPITSFEIHKLINPNIEFEWRGEKQKSHDKGFIDAVISYKNKDIRVLCGHLVPFRKFGKSLLDDEFIDIRNQIQDIILKKNLPCIICADMNCEDIHSIIPKAFEKGFKFVLKDLPTTPKNRKYDKILISKDGNCLYSKIVLGLADHYLCYCDIDF